jgi:phosphatidylglycerol---prolipoprotein diacylglyceryl transferase
MYPNFYYLFKDLFSVEIDQLMIINTFGFFVAMGFLAANYVMIRDFKRMENAGELKSTFVKQELGKKPSFTVYISNGIMGFILGYKIIWLLLNVGSFKDSVQDQILSANGSWGLGIAGAVVLILLKYYEVQKIAKKHPEVKIVDKEVHPYELMGAITLIAAVSGMIGAKLFDHLEHWDEFIKNPLNAFLDPFSGLTFYGGLIFGTIAVLIYAKKKGIPYMKMLDIGAPAMMLAYAVGRIGCHMSGDGDWGIVNQAQKPYSWLPDWLWAYDYPNNVARICDPYTSARCPDGAEVVLSSPVWPTPMFEVIVCSLLFVLLWKVRKRISVPGVLFFLYLTLNGLERFFIEKIRVNIKYHRFGMEITQAEIISGAMIIGGVVAMWILLRKAKKKGVEPSVTD